MCEDGVDSKFVLNNESINVDLPRPVSPEKFSRLINYISYWGGLFRAIPIPLHIMVSIYDLPMHIMLKVNPAATLWLTSWSGNESNPTCPPSCRFLSFGLFDPVALELLSAP